MCGIVGIASRSAVLDRGWLAAGNLTLAHRGPDDHGEWWSPDGRVGFGHRRLAIVDLSSAGHQPMRDATGRLCIIFNGEIYNFRELRDDLRGAGHVFTSGSDTEVILAAYRQWGSDCLSRLHGMFAFALHDGEKQQLFLARDRAGEKPLYYRLHAGEIRFASETKALLADPAIPRRVDGQALDLYLADGFISGAYCMLEGLRKLPPAHALRFDLASGETNAWRYWALPRLQPTPADEAELLDELERLLENAVRRQLVADVPVGVLLSGGVDSSLITAMAARANPAVKTFTVRFQGYGAYDETEHARLIASHFGTQHVEVEAEAAHPELLDVLARQFDEPMNDSSMVPTHLVSRVVRAHCTVALGGDGGDELFGGYQHYDRMLWMQRTFGPVPRLLQRACAGIADRLLPVGFRGRNWLLGLQADTGSSVPAIAQMFDRRARREILGNTGLATVAEAVREERMPRAGDLLQRATRLDFENYLADDLLVKVDRAAMLCSLEVRAPLLDVPLIEFAFGKVPSRLKATANERKVLLKRLAARVLPPAFDRARKQGFSIPLSAWLQAGPWRDYFRAVLLDPGQRLFDHASIEDMLQAEGRGRANAERLFGLVMFELWRREYRVELATT
jgi:asparagine synthase (glutamine-hydrolysing)